MDRPMICFPPLVNWWNGSRFLNNAGISCCSNIIYKKEKKGIWRLVKHQIIEKKVNVQNRK